MEKSGLKFNKKSLETFVFLTLAHVGQKMELEVLRNVTEKNRVANTKDGRTSESYITNFKAVAPDKFDALKELFKDRDEVDIEETDGLFVTGNNWINNGETSTALPMKGEKVDCLIGEVADRDGVSVIRVTSYKTRAAIKGHTINIDSFFKKEEAAPVLTPAVGAGELASN